MYIKLEFVYMSRKIDIGNMRFLTLPAFISQSNCGNLQIKKVATLWIEAQPAIFWMNYLMKLMWNWKSLTGL